MSANILENPKIEHYENFFQKCLRDAKFDESQIKNNNLNFFIIETR